MSQDCFVEPLDVLMLRGNRLYGDPGSYGDSLMPPWPSAAAGAIRSAMLSSEGVDLEAFGRGDIKHPSIGTPREPGSFTMAAFHLARRSSSGKPEPLFAPPADIVITRDAAGTLAASRMLPRAPATGLLCSAPLPLAPMLAETRRAKPEAGYWLSAEGWRRYLGGQSVQQAQLVPRADLWHFDDRVGVGLDAKTRSAADGRLFTVRAIAMRPGVGFAGRVDGAKLPSRLTLRLGGDGRAAHLSSDVAVSWPRPDFAALCKAGRARIVLTAPGIFAAGWLPTGVVGQVPAGQPMRFELGGVCANLVAAAVPRAEVVSGFDLARRQPKPAQRAAPSGSVYWLEELQANAAGLGALMERGLWPDQGADASRRAEGFNRFTFAAY